jgi:hypothetical protein
MKRAAQAALIHFTPGMVVGGDFRVVELLSAGGSFAMRWGRRTLADTGFCVKGHL